MSIRSTADIVKKMASTSWGANDSMIVRPLMRVVVTVILRTSVTERTADVSDRHWESQPFLHTAPYVGVRFGKLGSDVYGPSTQQILPDVALALFAAWLACA